MKTRFAPSPTGPFHIGSLRTALLVKLWAEKLQGTALLRLEDTDTKRSTPAYAEEILKSLQLSGLDFVAAPSQSQRLVRYQEVAQALLDQGLAYRCYMTAQELDEYRKDVRAQNLANPELKLAEKYDNRFRPSNYPTGVPDALKKAEYVIRLQLPDTGTTKWLDANRGDIEVPNAQLDDLIIVRSDGSPTYNFAVVVDDLDMGITHVVRGDDHISNTPRQIQIANVLKQLPLYSSNPSNGSEAITYCHVPLMFNPDGSKISKSALADPANADKVAQGLIVPAALKDYRSIGVLPQALINYLLLISAQKTSELIGREIFTYQEFMDNFELSHLSKTAAHFDLKKLYDINTQYIAALDYPSLQALVRQYTEDYSTAADSVETLSASTRGSIGSMRLADFDFAPLHTEIQKRSKTLSDVSAIYSSTHLSFHNLLSTVNPIAAQSPSKELYEKLLSAHDAVDFKEKMTAVAKDRGVKFGVVAHDIRTQLNITTGLPLFELFQTFQKNMAKLDHTPSFVAPVNPKIKM